MLISALVSLIASFAGTFGAILLYSHIQRMQRIKTLLAVKKELEMKLETEMTFAQMAEQLRKEMGDDIE